MKPHCWDLNPDTWICIPLGQHLSSWCHWTHGLIVNRSYRASGLTCIHWVSETPRRCFPNHPHAFPERLLLRHKPWQFRSHSTYLWWRKVQVALQPKHFQQGKNVLDIKTQPYPTDLIPVFNFSIKEYLNYFLLFEGATMKKKNRLRNIAVA